MRYFLSLLLLSALISCKGPENNKEQNSETEVVALSQDTLIYPEETHFKSLRQITFGGDNAEAYWSFDDKQLVFQSNP